MLCQFTFKNFKSYRNETVFDMQATEGKEFSDSLIPSPGKKFSALLPVSAIFGPNAGGKSNALQAFSYLVSRVLMPIKASKDSIRLFGTYVRKCTPFLLDTASRNEPSEFEIFFRTQSAQYQYQLSCIADQVVSESLFYTRVPCERRRTVLLIEREYDKITLGSALKKANAQLINPNIPCLSFLAINYNFAEIEDVITWFTHCCYINYGISGRDHDLLTTLDDEKIKPLVLSMLSDMDIPICDYKIQSSTNEEGDKTYRLITVHNVGDQNYPIEGWDESEGTVKILSAIPSVLLTLSGGGVLLADELDAKLHPHLLRFLIKLYMDPEINKKHAQLIFTCHDLSIMRSDFLRRDEIWFAARNEDSSSELWSLYDIRDEQGGHIKTSAAYDKQYLAGRYGADPYLKRIMMWGDLNE